MARRTLVSLILFLSLGLLPTVAHAVSCGDTITGRVTLDPATDFPTQCTGLPYALRITGPAVVDMNGVVVECADPFTAAAGTSGIWVEGDNVRLRNGGIRNCNAGIFATGAGHRFESVNTMAMRFDATGFPAIGFYLVGDGMQIRNSSASTDGDVLAFARASRGIHLQGDRNRVQNTILRVDRNTRDAVGIGVESGDGNKVAGVSATLAGSAGYGVLVDAAASRTSISRSFLSCSTTGVAVADHGSRTTLDRNRVSCRGQAFGLVGDGTRVVGNHTGDSCTGFYIGNRLTNATLSKNVGLRNRAGADCADLVFDDRGIDCEQVTFKGNLFGNILGLPSEACRP